MVFFWGLFFSICYGSGFQIFEKSASGLGRAFSGEGAIADDASVQATNPASQSRIRKRQLVFASTLAIPQSDFAVEAASIETSVDTLIDFGNSTNITGSDGGSSLSSAIIPALYYTHPIDARISLGLSLSTDFALSSERSSDFKGRFASGSTKITTIKISPSLSYRLNKQWSLGLSLNWVSAETLFRQSVPDVLGVSGDSLKSVLTLLGFDTSSLTGGLDGGSANISGKGSALGFRVGGLYQLQRTRFSVSYQPQQTIGLSGRASFEGCTSANQLILGSFTDICGESFATQIDLPLPAIWDFSAYHRLEARWALHGSFSLTEWKSFDAIRIQNQSTGGNFRTITSGLQNAARISIGATYFLNKRLRLRGGFALDKSSAATPTIQATDTDRKILAAGIRYRWNSSLSLDAGYSHFIFDAYRVSDRVELQSFDLGSIATLKSEATIQGNGINSVDMLAIQASYSF